MLAAVATVLGGRLLRAEGTPQRLWGGALVLTALAALVGGTEHGLRPRLDASTRFWMWEATYVAIGGANALLLAGAAAVALAGRARVVALALVGARFAAFVVVVTRDQRFVHAMVDFGLTLAVLAVFAAWGARRRLPFVGGLAAAIGLSLLGALVQGLRLAPHEHFNHNDLFHVLQTLGVACFHRAGARLPGIRSPGPP